MKSPALIAAFCATTYRVKTPNGVFELRIGVRDPAFDDALTTGLGESPLDRANDQQVNEWAIVTAFNPGTRLDDQENVCRQARMEASIVDSGWKYWPALNIADDGLWPVEASFLLLQVDHQQMLALARRFGQCAVVVGRQGMAPRLLWIDDGD